MFFEKKQMRNLICSKNCEMNDFLAILELCAFYIEFKKVKFMLPALHTLFHIEQATFFKKGQLERGLKQLNLEQNPGLKTS